MSLLRESLWLLGSGMRQAKRGNSVRVDAVSWSRWAGRGDGLVVSSVRFCTVQRLGSTEVEGGRSSWRR